MHYVILLYGDESAERALTRDELQGIVTEHRGFADRLRAENKLVFGAPLEDSAGAKVVRGEMITDGPFAETKEQLGGFYVVDCADLSEALEWARQIPRSPGLVVEVRKAADYA